MHVCTHALSILVVILFHNLDSHNTIYMYVFQARLVAWVFSATHEYSSSVSPSYIKRDSRALPSISCLLGSSPLVWNLYTISVNFFFCSSVSSSPAHVQAHENSGVYVCHGAKYVCKLHAICFTDVRSINQDIWSTQTCGYTSRAVHHLTAWSWCNINDCWRSSLKKNRWNGSYSMSLVN